MNLYYLINDLGLDDFVLTENLKCCYLGQMWRVRASDVQFSLHWPDEVIIQIVLCDLASGHPFCECIPNLISLDEHF